MAPWRQSPNGWVCVCVCCVLYGSPIRPIALYKVWHIIFFFLFFFSSFFSVLPTRMSGRHLQVGRGTLGPRDQRWNFFCSFCPFKSRAGLLVPGWMAGQRALCSSSSSLLWMALRTSERTDVGRRRPSLATWESLNLSLTP